MSGYLPGFVNISNVSIMYDRDRERRISFGKFQVFPATGSGPVEVSFLMHCLDYCSALVALTYRFFSAKLCFV